MKIEGNNVLNIEEKEINEWNQKFKNLFNRAILSEKDDKLNSVEISNILFLDELKLKGYEEFNYDERKFVFINYNRIDLEDIMLSVKNGFPDAGKEVFEVLNDDKKIINSKLSIIKELLIKYSSISYKEISKLIDDYVIKSKKDVYALSSYDKNKDQIILYNASIREFSKEFNLKLKLVYELAYIQSLFIKYYYLQFIYNPDQVFKYGPVFDKYVFMILDTLKTYFIYKYLEELNIDNKFIIKVLNDNYLLNGGLRFKEFPYIGLLDLLDENKMPDLEIRISIINNNLNHNHISLSSALKNIFDEYQIEKLLDDVYEECFPSYF